VRRPVPEPLMLLALIVSKGSVRGKLTLHRIAYEAGLQYGWVRYSFGPYSKELDRDLELLISSGLIRVIEDGEGVPIFAPTKKGIDVATSLGILVRAKSKA